MLFAEVMCVLQVSELQRQLQAATHEQQLCRQQLEAEQRNGAEVSSRLSEARARSAETQTAMEQQLQQLSRQQLEARQSITQLQNEVRTLGSVSPIGGYVHAATQFYLQLRITAYYCRCVCGRAQPR